MSETEKLKQEVETVSNMESSVIKINQGIPTPKLDINSDQHAMIRLDFKSDNTSSRKKILSIKIEKDLWDNSLSKWEKIVLRIVFQFFPGFELIIVE